MEKQSLSHKSRGGYLEALLTSCPVAIMATNAEGTITFANGEACKLTERQMQELVGENIAAVYESLEAAREANRKLYLSAGVIHEHESRAKTKSGKIIPIRISASHLKDSSGNYMGAVGYFEKYRPWTTAEANVKAYADGLEAKLQEWKDLGAPVFELYPGLTAVVIVGRLDVDRFTRINTNLLDHIRSSKSQVVLIDLSSALVDDDNVANQLIKTVRTVHLLGAYCVLAGIQSSVAQTMEPLIADLNSIKSFCSTNIALEAALEIIGFKINKAD